jgi:hypothetical protein
MEVVSFTSLPLYPRYLWNRRLDGPQNRSGRCWEKKTSHCRESNLGRPTRSPSLYRLSYPGSYSEGTSQYNKRTQEENMKFIWDAGTPSTALSFISYGHFPLLLVRPDDALISLFKINKRVCVCTIYTSPGTVGLLSSQNHPNALTFMYRSGFELVTSL